MTINKTKRLGRGLEALLGAAAASSRDVPGLPVAVRDEVRMLSIAIVRPNPFQPRREFRPDELTELEASLRENGLLQPVTVRPAPSEDGRFELIVGERRLRAAARLGWTEIPALIKLIDDRAMLTLALVENLQRADLNPIDEALGVQRLIAEFGLTQQQVADALGKDRSTIANLIRVLALPAGIQRMVLERQLSLGHARALLPMTNPRAMLALARQAAEQQLSVREVELRARDGRVSSKSPTSLKTDKQSSTTATPVLEHRRAVDALRRFLQTDVRIASDSVGRGDVTIAFYSADDLQRLVELILPGKESVG